MKKSSVECETNMNLILGRVLPKLVSNVLTIMKRVALFKSSLLQTLKLNSNGNYLQK